MTLCSRVYYYKPQKGYYNAIDGGNFLRNRQCKNNIHEIEHGKTEPTKKNPSPKPQLRTNWCADVLPSVFGIDALEVVSTGPDVVDRAFWNIIGRVVVLLPKLREKNE